MPEKYDLKRMLEEIKEDEKIMKRHKDELSQDMIEKIMMENLKKKKAKNG